MTAALRPTVAWSVFHDTSSGVLEGTGANKMTWLHHIVAPGLFWQPASQIRGMRRTHQQDLRQQLLPKRKQRILGKVGIRIRMVKIQSIAIELADARGSDDDAMRILERKDIQGRMYGIAKRLFCFQELSAAAQVVC